MVKKIRNISTLELENLKDNKRESLAYIPKI